MDIPKSPTSVGLAQMGEFSSCTDLPIMPEERVWDFPNPANGDDDYESLETSSYASRYLEVCSKIKKADICVLLYKCQIFSTVFIRLP